MNRTMNGGVQEVLDGDEVRDVLRETFFTPGPTRMRDGAAAGGERKKRVQVKAEHYKVICISLYNEDLARLDAVVKELKRRGFTKANRSAVLRVAMAQLDLDRVPRGL